MDQTLRLIDANLNRAAEALRAMEDVARFVLEDADLARDLKAQRHELRSITAGAGVDAGALAAWRDTAGDVGTGMTSEAERARGNIRDVATAAGKRAGEALRVLEETLKILPDTGMGASSAKALRYRAYDLEKRLVLALGSGRSRQWRLCVLISERLCGERPWDQVARVALRGGADCVQLREKTLTDRELLRRATALAILCREHDAACIINDRADIALLAGADGVHVGQEDLDIAAVRRLAGFSLLVGVSTSCLDQARAAARDGADYCGCGPMFDTSTKHKARLAGPEYLREYLECPQTGRIPHLAIGGVNGGNVGALARVGCAGVAVSSAVCSAPDPEAACREILRPLGVGEIGIRAGASRITA